MVCARDRAPAGCKRARSVRGGQSTLGLQLPCRRATPPCRRARLGAVQVPAGPGGRAALAQTAATSAEARDASRRRAGGARARRHQHSLCPLRSRARRSGAPAAWLASCAAEDADGFSDSSSRAASKRVKPIAASNHSTRSADRTRERRGACRLRRAVAHTPPRRAKATRLAPRQKASDNMPCSANRVDQRVRTRAARCANPFGLRFADGALHRHLVGTTGNNRCSTESCLVRRLFQDYGGLPQAELLACDEAGLDGQIGLVGRIGGSHWPAQLERPVAQGGADRLVRARPARPCSDDGQRCTRAGHRVGGRRARAARAPRTVAAAGERTRARLDVLSAWRRLGPVPRERCGRRTAGKGPWRPIRSHLLPARARCAQ